MGGEAGATLGEEARMGLDIGTEVEAIEEQEGG